MSLASNYFLLYHGINLKDDYHDVKIGTSHNDDFLTSLAIILIVSRKDFEKFIILKSFLSYFDALDISHPRSIEELYPIQNSITNYLESNATKKNIDTLNNTFNRLKEESILNYDNHKKILSLFETVPSPATTKQITKLHNFSFKDEKNKVKLLIEEFKLQLGDETYNDRLEVIRNYLEAQKFSIGITGVINAGKSTLLNALLGKELLGSAVVPETLNLTLIKHATTENAKVFYWSKREYSEMFGETSNEHIQEIPIEENIEVSELSTYTSAKSEKKVSQFIKYVELGVDLPFLRNGVELVDTPGLDDPVVKREEVTKEYVSRCDMMLHLMNVSQSATSKDIEFLIDALLYQNISKLLVVITRADTVGKKELEEVILYTKESIKQELARQNKNSKLDFILETIEFIPVSGYMALNHRIGKEQEALDAGYTLEDTGILQIEKYLNENLFGSSSVKGELIIKSALSQLKHIVDKESQRLHFELQMCSKSQEELELELVNLKVKRKLDEKHISEKIENLVYESKRVQEYFLSLQNFLNSEILELQTTIRQRVVTDVRYSLEQTKKLPQNSRIRSIVETGFKDGIIDIIRDYRYKLIKKLQLLTTNDVDGIYKESIRHGFLVMSLEPLLETLVSFTSTAKLKSINELDIQINASLKEYFSGIENKIYIRAHELAKELVQEFFYSLKEPLLKTKEKLAQDEESLCKYLQTNDLSNTVEYSLEIHQKIKNVELLSEKIEGMQL